jgi:RNA polymerase sigma-70 factor (ECF subfamily)
MAPPVTPAIVETTGETSRTPSPSDEQLAATYQRSGETRVLEELARRHLPKVNSLVSQIVLEPAAAEDVTQEVFLRAFRQLDSFRGDSRFGTWLYRVALNTAYSYQRRRDKSPVEYRGRLYGPDTNGTPPEGPMLQAELDGEIRAALSELSPKLRAAVVLTSIQGFKPAEAAEIEGCTIATMYWRIHKARKLLHRRLKDYLSP